MTEFETDVTKTAQDREQAGKERHTLQHGLSQQLDGLRQGMSDHTDAMCGALDGHKSAATDTNRLQLQCVRAGVRQHTVTTDANTQTLVPIPCRAMVRGEC